MGQEEKQSKIIVSRMPATSVATSYGLTSSVAVMQALAIIPAREKTMLNKVAFAENLISTSSFAQHFCALDSNVKKEKVGKSRREG